MFVLFIVFLLVSFCKVDEILPIAVLQHGLCQFDELVFVYPSLFVCYLFKTCNLQTLPLLYHFNEGAGF